MGVQYYETCRRDESLTDLALATLLLEFDLTILLDEAANMTAIGSEAVATTATGDVVTPTNFPSPRRLWGG